ncbi:hypothetical protein [uncultured Winogradskyella sp.]|nr:hypothetical protein [uncultured Winogradskyella sp.]
MELYDYITGKGGLILLGFIVVSVLFYKKYKTQRYFKYIEKKEKERNSK